MLRPLKAGVSDVQLVCFSAPSYVNIRAWIANGWGWIA
jgi:hypothetical protein